MQDDLLAQSCATPYRHVLGSAFVLPFSLIFLSPYPWDKALLMSAIYRHLSMLGPFSFRNLLIDINRLLPVTLNF